MPYYPEKKPELPGEGKKQAPAEGNRKKRLRPAAAAVSCILILYGTVRLVMYSADLNASRNTSAELQQIYTETEAPELRTDLPSAPAPATGAPPQEETPQPETAGGALLPAAYPGNPGLKVSEQFQRLRRKSGYIIGWISFDQVEEAVALKDNVFFLDHDATGKKNSNGAIFLDAGISLLTRPYTVILYGHNMKSGNMFGRLKKYRENAYFNRNRIITFNSLYEDGQYAVFAVMEMSTVPGTARWYDLWSLDTESRADREKAIRTLQKLSEISSPLDVRADEQILLLVTCLDGDTDRLVVAARRLREGETADTLALRQD